MSNVLPLPTLRSDSEGMFRLLVVAMRRYERDPGERENATRLMLAAAVHLHAVHASPATAAMVAAEAASQAAKTARDGA